MADRYERIPEWDAAAVEAAIVRGEPEELSRAVVAAALYADDPEWAESVCLQLARHPHPNVRGNAVLGFGHIARIHGRLSREQVLLLVRAALVDDDEYVRGQADAAAGDLAFFLGWPDPRPT